MKLATFVLRADVQGTPRLGVVRNRVVAPESISAEPT
jgi:hypothetical protein